jgi:dienelactone hydrolase
LSVQYRNTAACFDLIERRNAIHLGATEIMQRKLWITMPFIAASVYLAGLLLLIPSPVTAQANQPATDDGTIAPEVAIQSEDYQRARKSFRTKLVKHGGSPQHDPMPPPPAGVTAVEFSSGKLKLMAWINPPETADGRRHPAVLFLHGGFGFGHEEWEMAQPFRDAGFIVMAPMLRGENGQPGDFTLFYDEVDYVLAAARFLRNQPYVDRRRIFVAGHSAGGTLALLAAEARMDFRAAASFSGSPDQVIFVKVGFSADKVPFDQTDPRELQLRSPLAYSASFKCPVRIFFGTKEPHFRLSSERTAALAKQHGSDVGAIQVDGSHFSAVPAEMKQSIEFFLAQ